MEHMDPQLDTINTKRIEDLDDMERQMYKQKLMIEIAHFKQREQLYAQRRHELLQLEQRFRGNQQLQVKAKKSTQGRGDTANLMIEGLQDKVNDARRKRDLQRGACDDLEDKVEESRDTIRQRQGELNEIKKVIEAKAEKGR